jgi:pectin methylesterase-like acyl-CoA thioesterase
MDWRPVMNARLFLALGVGFLLAACGTLKVDIVFETTPSYGESKTQPVVADTQSLTMSEIHAPVVRTPSIATPSWTPAASSAPAETAVAIAVVDNHNCAFQNRSG